MDRLDRLRYPVIPACGIALTGGALERLSADADAFLSEALRQERRLGSQPRRLVADAIHELFRRLKLLEFLLKRGGWGGERRAEALWWAALCRSAGLPPEEAAQRFGAPVFSGFQDLEGAARELCALPEAERLSALASLPRFAAEQLLAERGEGAWGLAEALGRRAPVVLRVNRRLIDPRRLRERLSREGVQVSPGRWCEDALIADERTNFSGLSAWREGLFEIQDEGSQLIAELVAPPPGARVVDFCAGAGGKSLAVAARMEGGQLLALDVRGEALAEAERRARRAKIHLRALRLRPGEAPPVPEGSADRVLVDAPCSGSGVIRRRPASRWRLLPELLAPMPELQSEILDRASALVRPGGWLIYATCSLFRAENQGVADAFLERRSGWSEIPLSEILGGRAAALGCPRELEIDPLRQGTDGFFARAFLRER